jgi:hypothetical protein
MVAIILAILGSNGLWAVVNSVLTNRRKKKSVERQAMLALLHDRLYRLCQSYIKQGYVKVDQLDNLMYLWQPYEGLGGNGTGKKLYDQVLQLPLKEVSDE